MQRQDDFQITRDAMLAFIMQMLSLAGLAMKIATSNRHVDDLVLRSFIRSEHVMLVLLAGIMGNVDTRRDLPDLDQFELPPDSIDRHAELISIAASFQQIAMTLAMLLAMHPRAFRDRQRTPSFRGGLILASFRGGAFPPPCGQGGPRSGPGGIARGSAGSNSGMSQRRGSPGGCYPTPGLRPDPPLKGEGALNARAPP